MGFLGTHFAYQAALVVFRPGNVQHNGGSFGRPFSVPSFRSSQSHLNQSTGQSDKSWGAIPGDGAGIFGGKVGGGVWSAPFGVDRYEAAQLAICRACSCSNLIGLLYPSAEWRRLAL